MFREMGKLEWIYNVRLENLINGYVFLGGLNLLKL